MMVIIKCVSMLLYCMLVNYVQQVFMSWPRGAGCCRRGAV